MAREYTEKRARRVVAGLDENGKSIIIEDSDTEARLITDAFTINQIWQVESIPPNVLVGDTTQDGVSISPPSTGLFYLSTTFPPDCDWNLAEGYKAALETSGDGAAFVDDAGIAGLHQTDTVDIITVISGEIYAVLESSETLLKPGDSFVQRGTKHTWSNRSDKPCTIVAVMMGAVR